MEALDMWAGHTRSKPVFFEQVSRLALTPDGNLLVLGSTRVYEVPFERQYVSKYLL